MDIRVSKISNRVFKIHPDTPLANGLSAFFHPYSNFVGDELIANHENINILSYFNSYHILINIPNCNIQIIEIGFVLYNFLMT